MSSGYAEVPYIRHAIRMLCLCVVILSLIGLVFVYSSSSVYALERLGSANVFFKKQSLHVLLAFAGGFICALCNTSFLQRSTVFFYVMSLLATTATLFPGIGICVHGATRWLSILGFSVQPSEFFAVAFLLHVSAFFADNTVARGILTWRNAVFATSVLCGLVVLLLQPDFGAVATLVGTILMVFAVTSLSIRYIVMSLIACIFMLAGLIVMVPYRLRRIMIFLNPWQDPKGRGFQIVQSLIAIGSGNIWGLGIGRSQQKFFYLPMQHTDFVFSVIAEETGLVGVVAIIILFVAFCYFGLRIALLLKNEFASITTLSFVSFITIRALLNMMVTSALLPTKGIGLPFISFGGSAMVAMFCMVGIIASFVRSETSRNMALLHNS